MQVSRNLLIHKIKNCFPFNRLDDAAISNLIDHAEVLFFEIGQIIFRQGATGNSVYLVLEGEVGVLPDHDGRMSEINRKREGSIFGEEALIEAAKRLAMVRAETNLMVMKIPAAIVHQVQSKDLVFINSLKILVDSFFSLLKNRGNTPSGEEIIYFGRQHLFNLIARLFPAFLLIIGSFIGYLFLGKMITLVNGFIAALSAILVMAFITTWQLVEWEKNTLLITGNRVISKNVRLLRTENVMDTPLTAIMNIRSVKSLAGKLLGFGHLSIDTYTGENQVQNVPLVEFVQMLVEFRAAAAKQASIAKEQEAFKKILSDRQKGVGFAEDEILGKTLQVVPGSSDLSGSERTIIYRTHWIILLKKVLIPSLLFSLVILTSAFLYLNRAVASSNYFFFTISFLGLSFSLIWWLYQYFDWFYDRFQIIGDQIIDINQKPFGREEKRSASIFNIQSIRFERKGVVGMLLNFGTVYIRIGDEEFTFDNVSRPAEIQSRIFNLLEASLSGKVKKELTAQQVRLANWLEAYQQFQSESKQKPE